jgi:hypothetical protein
MCICLFLQLIKKKKKKKTVKEGRWESDGYGKESNFQNSTTRLRELK